MLDLSPNCFDGWIHINLIRGFLTRSRKSNKNSRRNPSIVTDCSQVLYLLFHACAKALLVQPLHQCLTKRQRLTYFHLKLMLWMRTMFIFNKTASPATYSLVQQLLYHAINLKWHCLPKTLNVMVVMVWSIQTKFDTILVNKFFTIVAKCQFRAEFPASDLPQRLAVYIAQYV